MTNLTEADYEVDMETLMASLGIEPGTVIADSAKLQFLDGKAVLTYSVMRAIPPRVLGVAMLRSATTPQEAPEMPEGDDPRSGEVTPIKKAAAKRTTKKAAKK